MTPLPLMKGVPTIWCDLALRPGRLLKRAPAASGRRPLSFLVLSNSPGIKTRNRPVTQEKTMTGVNEVRSTFLDYFKPQRPSGRGFELARATQRSRRLMFTAAGMVQFKNVFTGVREPRLL